MTPSEQKSYRSNIRKAYVFKFLTMFHFFAGVLIPFFTIWGGIKFSQVMILQAIFTISIFLFEVPTGAVADKFGRKTSLVLASIATALGAFIYGLYPNFWLFVLGEVVWGLGFALLSGADQAILYDSLKELGEESRSKKILGRWESVGIIAITIAAPLGSLIAKYVGLRFAMLFMAAPFLTAGVVALTFKEPEIASKGKKKRYLQTIKDGFKYLKGHKALQILAFDYISISALSFFIVWIYQVKLEKLGVPIEWFGFVTSALTISQIAVLNSFTTLDRVFGGKRRYTFVTALIIGASFIVLAVSRNLILSLVVMSLISAFGLTRRTLFQNYMNKYIESHNRATVLSSVSMLYSLSISILNIIWGYMVDWNMTVTLIVIGSLTIVLALFSRVEEAHLLD